MRKSRFTTPPSAGVSCSGPASWGWSDSTFKPQENVVFDVDAGKLSEQKDKELEDPSGFANILDGVESMGVLY